MYLPLARVLVLALEQEQVLEQAKTLVLVGGTPYPILDFRSYTVRMMYVQWEYRSPILPSLEHFWSLCRHVVPNHGLGVCEYHPDLSTLI